MTNMNSNEILTFSLGGLIYILEFIRLFNTRVAYKQGLRT